MSDFHSSSCEQRTAELMRTQRQAQCARTDRMFGLLMIFQWVCVVGTAVLVTPTTWIGQTTALSGHLWAAVIWGALISFIPVWMTVQLPGRPLTRHTVAISQVLFSAFLIHLTGGRTTTHFHLFGSLAFLAFYGDWKVLLTASTVITLDQCLRARFFPASVFGVEQVSDYRWLEVTGWVVFIDFFLIASCRRELRDARESCRHQAELEMAKEMTERRIVERTTELKAKTEEAELLALVARYTDNAVVITNAQAHIEWVNEGFERCTGYSLDDVKGQVPGHLLQGPDTDPQTVDLMRACLARGEGFEVELINYDSQQRPYWVAIECRPIHDETGRVTRFIAIESDITARKKHEQQLRLYSKAVSEANDAIIISEAEPIHEPGPRIQSVNAAFEDMTGYSADEIIGCSPRILQGDQSDPATRDRIRECLKNWQPVREEILNYRKDGRPFWVELNIAPLADEEGRYTHWVSVQRNITDRKEQEAERARLSQQLADASRQAGMAEVATGVLHNVGNVLNSVNVSTQLLLERSRNSPIETLQKASDLICEHESDLAEFVTTHPGGRHLPAFLKQLSGRCTENDQAVEEELQILNRHIEHIRQIISTQQSLARSVYVRMSVLLEEVIEDAILTLRESFQRHEIHLRRQLDAVPEIESDRNQILQILVNLLKNAQQAIDGEPGSTRELFVRQFVEDDFVVVEVEDTGSGIAQENLARVFAHGFTTKADGHGFGLHSCANAARTLGGDLSVHSDGPGRGALFRLRLPLQRSADMDTASHSGLSGERPFQEAGTPPEPGASASTAAGA